VPHRLKLLPALLVALLAGALTHSPLARAAGPEVGVGDDRVLLAGGKKADKMVAEWAADGVDTVRIYASWGRIAPSPKAKKVPKGFDPTDPNAGYNWYPYDLAIQRVRAAGMKVMLTLSGSAPYWATAQPGKRSPITRPRASAFANFTRAAALHFGPSVDRYVIWNEPNSGAFLLPQTRHHAVASAQLYRDLVNAAYPAIRKADPGAQVLIGALAPKGAVRKNVTTAPLAFLRAFGCVNDRYKKVRTGACKHYKAPTGDGFTVHPYGARTAPDLPPRGADDVNISTLSRLEKVLDRLHRLHRLKGPKHLGIYVDEYGYQTRPDRTSAIPARLQDAYLQRGAYLAWRDKRVKLFAQYLWYDEPKLNGSYSTWQSGVRYLSGAAKPSLRHFDTPFALDAQHNRLWGQVRPGGRATVVVQQRAKGRSAWKTLKRVRTDARGYWHLKRKLRAGTSYRFVAGSQTSSALRR
jgi:hypothetical protein